MKRELPQFHTICIIISLLCATTMQAQMQSDKIKNHKSDGIIHFNWDCYDQNLPSADEALSQVWKYMVSTGELKNDTTAIIETSEPSISPSGTEHHYYHQGEVDRESVLKCDIIISTRNGRPYFVTGALHTKAMADSIPAEVLAKSAKAPRRTVGFDDLRVTDGETVTSTVNTFFNGPQSINYTKQGDKAVLYDAKHKIYALAASEAEVDSIVARYKDDDEQDISNFDNLLRHLPFVSDDVKTSFTGDEYTDYQPELHGIRCNTITNYKLKKNPVRCTVVTPDGDTLATGTFAIDPNDSKSYLCQFDKTVPITRYDLSLVYHAEAGGYKDTVHPLYITGTTDIETVTISDYYNPTVSIEPEDSDLKSFTLKNQMPVFSLKRKQPYLDAFWGMQKTLEFYQDVFGYDSYDDKGSPVYLLINPSPKSIGNAKTANSSAVNGSEYSMMMFGMGYMIKAADLNKRRIMPLVDIVVTGHEFTHLVQHDTPSGGFFFNGESGALNESFADIMGACVEAYALGTDHPKYVVGDNSFVYADADIGGYGNLHEMIANHLTCPLRRMDNPSAVSINPQPSVYKGEYWHDTSDGADSGGVHTNSGVHNRWFYLLANQVGLTAARDLCFAEIRYYTTNHADYHDICEIAKAAAKYHGLAGTTFGDDSAANKLYTAVVDCWKECGLGDETTGINDITNASDIKSRKVIRDGRIVIIRNGVEHDVMGVKIKR